MNNLKITLLILITFFMSSCNQNEEQKEDTILGLWIVKKVNMDSQEITPIARWMRFDKDSIQSSGNGWLQHSIGTWSLNSKNVLSIINTNGILDEAEPFQLNLEGDKMTWQRKEEGTDVTVHLERRNKIPTSEANKLLGLWKFDSILVDDKEVSDSLNPKKNAMLFLRWDNTYELRNYPKGEKYGMFKTHGHRLQIDMVSYSKKPEFQFYTFSLKGKKLVLKSTNSNKEIKLTKIHQFLQ